MERTLLDTKEWTILISHDPCVLHLVEYELAIDVFFVQKIGYDCGQFMLGTKPDWRDYA